MKKLDLDICKKLREEGHTYKEIAGYFDVSKQAVFDLLNKSGVKRKTKHSEHYQDWERLYKEGVGGHTIAKMYKCSENTVYTYISRKFVIERGQLVKKKRMKKIVPETVLIEG